MDAAYAYHVRLLRRTPATVSVSLPGGLGGGGGDGLVMDFDVLHVLPFDSTRKRMSVILKHPMTNEIILYTKVQSGLSTQLRLGCIHVGQFLTKGREVA